MYTHVIADLTKEFHCARCGIVQPLPKRCTKEWPFEFTKDMFMLIDHSVCEACHNDLKPSSLHPPSEPSQQT